MGTTKKDIVRTISEQLNLPQADVRRVVQGFLGLVISTLVTEGRLELRNFGVFLVKQRGTRKGRNPKSGVEVVVPPRNVVTFTPGKAVQDKVRTA